MVLRCVTGFIRVINKKAEDFVGAILMYSTDYFKNSSKLFFGIPKKNINTS